MKTTTLHLVLMLFFCFPLKHFGQTVSNKENPIWINADDWSLGVPLNGGETAQNVILNNNSNINYDIKIHHTVTINAGKTLTTSGKIEISKGGKLIVYGQVIISDESLELKHDGTLFIKDSGYFEGGGTGEFKLDGNGFHLEKGGKMTWDSKLTIDDTNALVKVDGTLVAKELKNEGTIQGSGSLEVTEKLDNRGTTFDCTTKNCCASYPCFLETSQIDDEPPVFTYCPSNIELTALPGTKSREAEWKIPVAKDNVGVVLLESNYNPFYAFPIGTTTVIYTAKDKAGNASSCSFDVTILDKEPPVISNIPEDIKVYCAAGSKGLAVDWIKPTASDNDMIDSFKASQDPGSFFEVGYTVVTYTATDKSGNSTTASFQVFVIEKAINPPVFSNCPMDINLPTLPGESYAVATWKPPFVAGGDGNITIISSHASGQKFDVGTTNMIYQAIDESGNTAFCSFKIVVFDNENPTFIQCPDNITAYLDNTGCYVGVRWPEPTYTDNVEVTRVDRTRKPGDSFNVGISVVEYKIYDKAGNFANCTFKVQVLDTISPTIKCPSDQVFSISQELKGIVVDFEAASAIDNCEVISVKRIDNLNYKSGDFFPKGEYVLSFSALDISNNSSSCNTNITIETMVPEIDVVATDDQFKIKEDESTSLDVLSNDLVSIAGEKLFISNLLKVPENGTAEIVNNKIEYKPNENFAGKDVLAYQVCAVAKPDRCARGLVEIDILEVNDAPFLKDYSYDISEQGQVTLCLEMQDAEDNALVLNRIIDKPENAEIVSLDPDLLCFDFTTTTGLQRFLIEVCDNGEPSQCVNVELEFELEINNRLRVYKGISPNGDGYNDLWIIDGIEQFPDNTIRVFDRWGKLVYSVDNYNNEDIVWDGKANVGGGKILPNGSYFYRIDVDGNEVLKGYVELLK